MNKKIKVLIILLIILILIAICVLLSLIYLKNKSKNENYKNKEIEEKQWTSIEDENIMVIGINTQKNENENEENQNNEKEIKKEEPKPQENKVETKKEEIIKEEEKKEEKVYDAGTLTNEIYNLNSEIGEIYIPKTKIKIKVFSRATVSKLEKMAGFLYTTGGLNKKGVTLIVGHNRRNGKLFSNNKKLNVGDEFYFTDNTGVKLKYRIYDKFITTEEDMSFCNNDVAYPTMALSCCTDANNEKRLIIMGRVE